MPTIKFSTKLATTMGDTQGIIDQGAGTLDPGFARFSATDNALVSRIRIMSGPIPTQAEIDDAYPTWDRFTGSPTEILIDRQTVNNLYFDSINGVVTWALASTTADASGVASWWIWSGNQNYDPTDRGNAPGAPDGKRLPCIVGDITLVGGTGSMTLADLNIIAGQLYDIGPANFVMPRSYTYT